MCCCHRQGEQSPLHKVQTSPNSNFEQHYNILRLISFGIFWIISLSIFYFSSCADPAQELTFHYSLHTRYIRKKDRCLNMSQLLECAIPPIAPRKKIQMAISQTKRAITDLVVKKPDWCCFRISVWVTCECLQY